MSTPSQIVKSAWKQAGCPESLKHFVRREIAAYSSDSLARGPYVAWLANKAKARKARPRRLGLRRGGLL